MAQQVLPDRAARHAGQHQLKLIVAVMEVFKQHAGALHGLGVIVGQLDAVMRGQVQIGVAATRGHAHHGLLGGVVHAHAHDGISHRAVLARPLEAGIGTALMHLDAVELVFQPLVARRGGNLAQVGCGQLWLGTRR